MEITDYTLERLINDIVIDSYSVYLRVYIEEQSHTSHRLRMADKIVFIISRPTSLSNDYNHRKIILVGA